MSRRLVIDLASPRAAWRIPKPKVIEIRNALGADWEVTEITAPAVSDGDGAYGSGSPESIAAARGAEIYVGFGLPKGVAEAGRETLRWVHSGTAGVGGSIPHVAGTKIVLTNSAGIHAEPMADWVIAAVGYFVRGIDRMVSAQRQGRWAKEDFTDGAIPMREFRDLRLGVFGLGGIGNAVARRAMALGMSVAGVRRRPEKGGPPRMSWVGKLSDLPKLASGSDVLLIAAPHTTETAGAVDRTVLERLPLHAIVVNVSRGSLLDETALLDLLEKRRLRGAALDVFGTEPLPADHPFWRHARVLVSPHVSAVTTGFWERETALIVENIKRYLEGAPLTNVVDLEAGY
ncbi:MAG TPA: D-2-hydroxyacid dehydrogenase [Gemmatimonadales bacterium]|nr:D-2-hydroxyacid dehydrogenase [Gemmatimonadales bacterium]